MTPGVGPRLYQSLMERFGSAAAVLDAAPSELKSTPGVGSKIAGVIANARNDIDVDAELELCRREGIKILGVEDEAYPRMLSEIVDPPAALFVRGELQPCDAVGIAIVGTRHGTRYGLEQAERLAGGLARAGVTIVSGLARGIDAAAHRGAIDAGGRTLAVLGGGVLNIYPPEHNDLAEAVIASGAIMSEAPPRRAPMNGSFPQRNRIVTGLTLGVLVIEAAERSGALISARHAMEQNREVFAMPGRIDSRMSRGCHRLLRDGAKLVETIDDVLEELGPLVEGTSDDEGREIRHPAELSLNEQEREVLAQIDSDPTTIDVIVKGSGLPVHRVLATISALEMRRLIKRVGGQQLVRL